MINETYRCERIASYGIYYKYIVLLATFRTCNFGQMDGRVIVAGVVYGCSSPKLLWSRELFIRQCTKGDTTAAVDDAVDTIVSPWKSPATPIIKRPTIEQLR
jgi:hypothetical protein